MIDIFKHHGTSLESPATRAYAVEPSDTADLAMASRALNVSQSGLVQVTTTGNTIAQVYIAAGIPFPIRAVRVWATGTTAIGIVALS